MEAEILEDCVMTCAKLAHVIVAVKAAMVSVVICENHFGPPRIIFDRAMKPIIDQIDCRSR